MSVAAQGFSIELAGDNRNVTLVVVASIAFHLLIGVVIPLATVILWQPKKYSRPQVFELVRVPPAAAMAARQMVREAKRLEKKAVKPVPAKPGSKPVPQESKPAPDENVDELESLLGAIPAPASLTASGDFKYNAYLSGILSKIERLWNPAVEDRNISVVVVFTIFPTGTISDVRVQKSSGNAMLDNMGMRAVQMAAPFGKLPPGFSGNKLELTCELKPTRK
jgi:TonB family protein